MEAVLALYLCGAGLVRVGPDGMLRGWSVSVGKVGDEVRVQGIGVEARAAREDGNGKVTYAAGSSLAPGLILLSSCRRRFRSGPRRAGLRTGLRWKWYVPLPHQELQAPAKRAAPKLATSQRRNLQLDAIQPWAMQHPPPRPLKDTSPSSRLRPASRGTSGRHARTGTLLEERWRGGELLIACEHS